MSLKRRLKRPFKTIFKGAEGAGQQIAHATTSAYDVVADTLDDARHSVNKLGSRTQEAVSDTVDAAVEHAIGRVQAVVEERLEDIIADVRMRVLEEIERRRSGILLVGVGIGFGLLSSILVSFAGVYLLVTLLEWPVWSGYLLLGGLFALTSAILFVLGRKHLNDQQ